MRMRVCVCIDFNKTDCSTPSGITCAEQNVTCRGGGCPGGLPTISLARMVTAVLPFLCACVCA